MAKIPAALWKNIIAIQIYGANTGVGKTVFSTLLGAHFGKYLNNTKWNVKYIKPVSTGPLNESDHRYVHRFTSQNVATLYQFSRPVSPHIAAREASHIPTDEHLNQLLYSRLEEFAQCISDGPAQSGIALVETAGGVLSPGPSGTLQADLFRPLRLPAVLVGDHRLGGISSTISAAESLLVRGYDIDMVVCFDDGEQYENANYLNGYFESLGITAVTVPWIPDVRGFNETEEVRRMSAYYDCNSNGEELHRISRVLMSAHTKRLSSLETMAMRTNDVIWHPFTQHSHVKTADEILVFDSAYGDYFQVRNTSKSVRLRQGEVQSAICYPAFDGSASWWTQGLGHGNPKLALQAAYAAGRYGHVMFAGATHEPALTLAERVLKGLDNPRLEKIFYTDNGSTAAEVGIKMALRASCQRYGWAGSDEEIGVLGLKGSYHGDTMGAMDASEPCVFNKKVEWYRGRGYWFDFPVVKISQGRWVIQAPQGMENDFGPTRSFSNMDEILDFKQRAEDVVYEDYIRRILDRLVRLEGRKFGALVMEPVVLGAGGMLFVDPLFQHTLVRVVRQYEFSGKSSSAHVPSDNATWTGLPVMFDEVFTGLYRLGRFSSSTFLRTDPDISVHAKLLTGGLLPLAITAASRSIFDAFLGNEKADALLHGHSYTAHPIGCHIANVSLRSMEVLEREDPSWRAYKHDWEPELRSMQPRGIHTSCDGSKDNGAWSMWSLEFVLRLSRHERVAHVNALGSLLAVTLLDHSGSGYTSSAAFSLRDDLLNRASIHSRVLGNVIYIMASMKSQPAQLREIETTFFDILSQRS